MDERAEMVTECVRTTLAEMAPVKLIDHLREYEKYHAVPLLIRKERVVFEEGPGPWQHVYVSFGISQRKFPATAREVVDLILARRADAVCRLLRKFEEAFYLRCGKYKNPKGWRVVILRGWWMREEVEAKVCGQPLVTAAYLDCTFRFEQLPQRKPVASEA